MNALGLILKLQTQNWETKLPTRKISHSKGLLTSLHPREKKNKNKKKEGGAHQKLSNFTEHKDPNRQDKKLTRCKTNVVITHGIIPKAGTKKLKHPKNKEI